MPADIPRSSEHFSDDRDENVDAVGDAGVSEQPGAELAELDEVYDEAVAASHRTVEGTEVSGASGPADEQAAADDEVADEDPDVSRDTDSHEEDETVQQEDPQLPKGVRPLTEQEQQNLERGLPPDHTGSYEVTDPDAKREEIERARQGYGAAADSEKAEPDQPADGDPEEPASEGADPGDHDESAQAGGTAGNEDEGGTASQGEGVVNGEDPPEDDDGVDGEVSDGPDGGEEHEDEHSEDSGDREDDGSTTEPGDGEQGSGAGSEGGDRSISDIIGDEHLTRIAYDFPIGTVDDVFRQASQGNISPVEDSVAHAAALPPDTGMVVADIGAGTGNTASSWRATLEGLSGVDPDQLQVVALDRQDLSHESMDPGTIQDCETGRVDYRVGDATHASEIIGSGTAQFVMVHRLLDLVDDPATAVRIVDEAIKVAAPGGTIYIDGKDEPFDPESAESFPQALAVDDYLQELAQQGHTVETYQDMPADESGEVHLTPFYKITKSGS